jgi:hypothetical protein
VQLIKSTRPENGMITFLPFFVPPEWTGVDERYLPKLSKMISELQECLETHKKILALNRRLG